MRKSEGQGRQPNSPIDSLRDTQELNCEPPGNSAEQVAWSRALLTEVCDLLETLMSETLGACLACECTYPGGCRDRAQRARNLRRAQFTALAKSSSATPQKK